MIVNGGYVICAIDKIRGRDYTLHNLGRKVVINVKDVIEVKAAAVEVSSSLTPDLVSRWLQFAGVSPKTLTTYNTAVKQLFKHFADNQISRPRREDLVAWRDGLISAGRSASTVHLYVTAARLFFRWLAMEGLYPDVADHLKPVVKISREHKRDVLDAAKSAELVKSAGGKSITDLRDRAILLVMLTAGLRTIELERANADDFAYFGGACFLRVQGKGHSAKDQLVRVDDRVKIAIDEYLKARGAVKADGFGEPLFTSASRRNYGARISTQAIRKLVKARLRAIGVDSPRISAHSLRATAATQMLLNGVSLEQVQQTLRHASISTTMIYNHAVSRMKNNAEVVAADAVFAAIA